jgi:hypothetical protein
MGLADKLLDCINCKKTFTFSVEEQKLLCSRGYPNDPVRCPACRKARKNPNVQDEDNVKTSLRSGSYFR